MQEKLMKQTTFFTCIFTVIAMSGMLFFAANKECVYADEKQNENMKTVQNVQFGEAAKELAIAEDKMEASHFCIPLSNTMKDTNILVENNYIEHKLYITIDGLEKDFYDKHPLKANNEFVLGAFYQYKNGFTRIELQLDRLYEHNALVKNSNLYLNFSNPNEMYDKIVVIDAGHGGNDTGVQEAGINEKTITLSIALNVKEKLEKEGIKVYCTRTDDRNVPDEDRAALANQVNADLFISIHTAFHKNEAVFGVQTIYNPDYFIPVFGSIELSDLLERKIAAECGTQALGLKKANKDNVVVNKAEIPAAMVEVGYLTNEKERKMLTDREYADSIALGIYKTIIEAYQIME